MSIAVPATYLELVQRLWLECGVSGNKPTTVTNQIGESERLVVWIASAWMEIASVHQDWGFLLGEASWATIDGLYFYTPQACGIPANTFGSWDRETFRNYVTAAGLTSEVSMDYLDFNAYRDQYQMGALRDQRTRPLVVSIGPIDKAALLGPTPAAGYTMIGEYYKLPVPLVNNADEPDLPLNDRMIIVYEAMKSYAAYENAQEVYGRGEAGFTRIMARLEHDRLPEFKGPGTLF